jgi:phosphoribosyl 1,2-cyclic phosphodiesterase
VVGKKGRLLVLDAGSGMRALGANVESVERVDVLITHLHMDHIQGLPFFAPLHDPDTRVDVWGPISTTQTLKERLNRYLSPPLFPLRVRDLSNVDFHDVPPGTFDIDGIQVTADLVSHPGPTLGYRPIFPTMSQHWACTTSPRARSGPPVTTWQPGRIC